MTQFSILVSLLAAQAAPPSPALQGSIAIDGKATAVQYVCAYEEEDPFDDKKVRIQVVVALTAPSAAAVKSCKAANDEVPQRMQKDGIPGLVATIATPEMTWENGTLYANDKSYSYSFSGTDTVTRFEAKPSSGGLFAGRLWTNGEAKMSDWPALKVDVTFAVPLQKLAPKSPSITGAAALRHPATLAAKRFLTAMSLGNEPQIRANIVEDERAVFDERMKSPDKAKMLPMMKTMAADALSMPTASVSMRGNVAEVVFERADPKGTSREKTRFQLRQEQGTWRVTQGR